MLSDFLSSHPVLVPYVLLPMLIFLARITDVSMGTLRIIFISRGFRYWAPLIGFFEVLIWLIAITQIIRHMDKPAYYFAFAAGFATGTYLGMWFESKLAMGTAILRVITEEVSCQLLDTLKNQGYGLTCIEGKGALRQVKILFMIAKRKDIKPILKIVKAHNPNAVYTIEDVRSVNAATYPHMQPGPAKLDRRLFNYTRKSK